MGFATAATIAGVVVGAKLLTPKLPAAPPPPPQRDDPAIAEARKKQRASELRRKGRASTILSGGAGVVGDAPLSQPQALGG